LSRHDTRNKISSRKVDVKINITPTQRKIGHAHVRNTSVYRNKPKKNKRINEIKNKKQTKNKTPHDHITYIYEPEIRVWINHSPADPTADCLCPEHHGTGQSRVVR
jgi:hypothetical protein